MFVRGCEKFLPALAFIFCLALPGSCSAKKTYFFRVPVSISSSMVHHYPNKVWDHDCRLVSDVRKRWHRFPAFARACRQERPRLLLSPSMSGSLHAQRKTNGPNYAIHLPQSRKMEGKLLKFSSLLSAMPLSMKIVKHTFPIATPEEFCLEHLALTENCSVRGLTTYA